MGILRTNTVSGIETPTPVTGSVVFDGSGDYLTTSSADSFNPRTNLFTIEFFTYPNSTDMVAWVESGTDRNFYIETFSTTGIYVGDGIINNINVAAPPISKWTHIALAFDGTTYRLFYDGILQGSSTTLLANNTLSSFRIGATYDGSRPFNGYISNLRILKGTALYTSNFTPPTRELQPIGDTVLLCCNNSTSATAEATGKTITVNGNAAASTFSPGLVRDFTYGTQFDGVTKFDTQGYFVPPSGNTQNRYALGINEIVTNGLVLHLDAGNPFSYPATGVGTKWTDLSGNNNHGTLVNGVSYTDNNRGALVFDGTNDYVENSSPNLGITGDVSATLSCWFYDENTSTSTSQALLVYGNGPSAGDTIAIILQNLSFSAAYNGGQNVYIANNLYTLNGWNNAVITKTPGAVNTTTKLYLNGIQQTITSSSTITPNVVSRIIRVSRWSNEGSPIYFKGRVSNCLIYNRALSAAEVLQNYNALKDRYGHP